MISKSSTLFCTKKEINWKGVNERQQKYYYGKVSKRKRKEYTCQQCGVKFLKNRKSEIYCSEKCYLDYKNSIEPFSRLKYRKTYGASKHGKYKMYESAAIERGLEFRLTEEEFLTFWKKPCYYCGSAIETIGVDRVDNKQGYFIGNCQPCCTVCNKMKTNYGEKEFLEHCRKVYFHSILRL